jgi:hypothetical protein
MLLTTLSLFLPPPREIGLLPAPALCIEMGHSLENLCGSRDELLEKNKRTREIVTKPEKIKVNLEYEMGEHSEA